MTSDLESMPTNQQQNVPFPWKLHEMLYAAEQDGLDGTVSWLLDGRAFRVHDPNNFVYNVMQTFFKQTKYKSFQRQLNIWGFERILQGPAKGGYQHKHFVRGQEALCSLMKREKIKGTPVVTTRLEHSVATGIAESNTSVISDSMAVVCSLTVPQTSSLLLSPSSREGSLGGVKAVSSESLYDLQGQSTECITTPRTGDCLRFEGMKFFFLEEEISDYVAPPPGSGGGEHRRLSLQLFAASRRKTSSLMNLPPVAKVSS
jgi:hypothetical protein